MLLPLLNISALQVRQVPSEPQQLLVVSPESTHNSLGRQPSFHGGPSPWLHLQGLRCQAMLSQAGSLVPDGMLLPVSAVPLRVMWTMHAKKGWKFRGPIP